MRKIIRNILIFAFLIAALTTLSAFAGAIEMKTAIGTVTAGSLRLRASADTSGEILATAGNGDKVVIIRKVGDWYLVDYNLTDGYMSAEYLSIDPVKNIELGYGRVADGMVNMRAAPASDGGLVAQINQGEKPYIIGFNNGWYKVKYNGQTGYIRSDLLELTEKPACNGAAVTSVSDNLITYAKQYLGYAYVWGGTSPSGFDCSGFTKYVYNHFGYAINRTAAAQMSNGSSVSQDSLQVGDLVFFARTYSSSAAATHVGIYVGGGQFIHAVSGGVRITSLSDSYYASRYAGARRIL